MKGVHTEVLELQFSLVQSLCRLTLVTTTPPTIPLTVAVWAMSPDLNKWLIGLLGLTKPLRRNSEISHGCTLRHIDSRLLFQTWSKSVRDKCPKGRVVLVQKKNKTTEHVLAPFRWTPGAISPPQKKLRKCALWSHTYILGFTQIRLGLGSYNRKTKVIIIIIIIMFLLFSFSVFTVLVVVSVR